MACNSCGNNSIKTVIISRSQVITNISRNDKGPISSKKLFSKTIQPKRDIDKHRA